MEKTFYKGLIDELKKNRLDVYHEYAEVEEIFGKTRGDTDELNTLISDLLVS